MYQSQFGRNINSNRIHTRHVEATGLSYEVIGEVVRESLEARDFSLAS